MASRELQVAGAGERVADRDSWSFARRPLDLLALAKS
jgi:hypothetical protein